MPERIHSIDSVRAVAMAFIVAIHADAFRGLGTYGNVANFVLDTTGRFAVPFFFLTSGYLLAYKLAGPTSDGYVVTHLSKVASIYGWGVLLYAPLVVLTAAGTAAGNGQSVTDAVLGRGLEVVSPAGLFYYGDSVLFHLWFLPALAISLALVYAFVVHERTRYLLPIAIGLHAIGMLGQSYAIGIHVPFETRDALFFGFFYTSLGYCIRSWEWTPDPDRSSLYLATTAVFAAVHLGERYVLGYVLTGDSIRHGVYAPEYNVSTAFFAIALFVYVLSKPSLGRTTRLPTLGTYAVVIYVLHPVVLFALDGAAGFAGLVGYDPTNTVIWHLVLTPATYFGTLGVYLLVARAGVIRRVRDAAVSGTPEAQTP